MQLQVLFLLRTPSFPRRWVFFSHFSTSGPAPHSKCGTTPARSLRGPIDTSDHEKQNQDASLSAGQSNTGLTFDYSAGVGDSKRVTSNNRAITHFSLVGTSVS